MLTIAKGVSSVLTKIALTNRAVTASSAFHTANLLKCSAKQELSAAEEANAEEKHQKELSVAEEKRLSKDRSKVVPVETSIRYLRSSAYAQTYGEKFVWEQYRRNHKGLFPPKQTRKTCIRKGVVATGNPCPICRDEYLVVDQRNIELLRQFISPQTGQVLDASKTGLCQKKHFQVKVAVERAWDSGLISFDVPFREYDYSEYYGKAQQ